MSPKPVIQIQGARQHNLKNLDLEIPLHRLTVITGVSGSGKSSLALDTLYAEGQRRYVETFSPYARQFMDRMDRPRVARINGIPPAIAIDRKEPVRTSRSTVGTMTELTDYVKLLFARAALLHCRKCDRPVQPDTPQSVWETLSSLVPGTHLILTFPYVANAPAPVKGSHTTSPYAELIQAGYDRILNQGQVEHLAHLDPETVPTDVDVVADRIIFKPEARERLIDSAQQAFGMGNGRLDVWIDATRRYTFSRQLACAACGITYAPPVPNLFSFNSPVGACETCRGFGRVIDIDLDLVIPDRSLSIVQGAVKPWGDAQSEKFEYHDLLKFCRRRKIPTRVPFVDLTSTQQQAIIEGDADYYGIRGFFKWLESRTYKMPVRVFLSRYRGYTPCPDCGMSRFKPETLRYRLAGRSIDQVYAMNVAQADAFFKNMAQETVDAATSILLTEISSRLTYLRDVGLDYLTLDRQSRTLSGGEVQRVALASALGSGLVNTLYVLDEPSIGLHPRDSHRLVRILKSLRDRPNTVVVVEHDPEIIRESDYLLDLGPGAGEGGGQVVYFGPTGQVGDSLTGRYLTGRCEIPVPRQRRRPDPTRWLKVRGARANNLKGIQVALPLGLLVCLTGVSGSGKSTLAEEILFKGIKRLKGDPQGRPGKHDTLTGAGLIDDVVMVDQRSIGRTPRANLLTYTKALDRVRRLFAETPAAQAAGLTAGHFSFNVTGGRCEACKGEGFEKIEMQFLSDVYVTCPVCAGRRFKPEVIAATYRGHTIDGVLALTVAQAMEFFADQKQIVRALTPLVAVGLDYIRLGQPISTFSGGEAQRLKLARYLTVKKRTAQLFIFDEPTTGLHFDDIRRLLAALQQLVNQGHSVLVIEHNMDVIKCADWIIDLGPEGGQAGGRVVAKGPPQRVARAAGSHTAAFLKRYLSTSHRLVTHRKRRPASADRQVPNGHDDPRQGITVRGARQHNLQDLGLTIARNQLVALTGVSGSGKSTLAFDILFAEGQRRYLESLTPFVRQYVGVMERPEVDTVTGLSPAVAIEQRISHAGRRSTVATLTEVYHFLRLLFSKLGTPHCPGCLRPLTAQDHRGIVKRLQQRRSAGKALILAPKVAGRKGFHKEVLARARRAGYRQVRIDGQIRELTDGMALSRYQEHNIEIVIGSLKANAPTAARLNRLIEAALAEGDGALVRFDPKRGRDEIFSLKGICPSCGIGAEKPDPRHFSFNSRQGACPRCQGLGEIDPKHDNGGPMRRPCPACQGSRLNPRALAITVGGLSIWDLVQHPAARVQQLLQGLSFAPSLRTVADPILDELSGRLTLMDQLGLGYLPLSRSGDTLSGGEAQRIRLAAQLGSNLTGVTYILDEPTIGLHPRDNRILVAALRRLRDRGNTVLVVEHDEETIKSADTIIDLGPGAGRDGGAVVAQGSLADLKKTPLSVTGAMLDGHVRSITSRLRPLKSAPRLTLSRATINNLKGVTVNFPLQRLICVTGVSGSGKSSLVKETLLRGLQGYLAGRKPRGNNGARISGWQALDRVREVDHSPIGKTPRSVPASYIGFLGQIRQLFAATPRARALGYGPGRFSFNVAQGRCAACGGQGHPKVEMAFLPHVYVTCQVCRGRRFNVDTLAVRYKGRDMAHVLEMTFAEAVRFFAAIPSIRRQLQFVCDIGLGYLTLGQPSPTLSGGEAQRIKLAKQLAKPTAARTLFVLDEPTTGLHPADVQRLIGALQSLVDQGHSVVMIEHNLEMVAAADHIIDLGPEGGDQGGRVVAQGSPRQLLRHRRASHTARFLRQYLNVPATGKS